MERIGGHRLPSRRRGCQVWGDGQWMRSLPGYFKNTEFRRNPTKRFFSPYFKESRGRDKEMPAPVGFFPDPTICIGCKACQVACHQWNDLPAEPGPNNGLPVLSGNSYDNTGHLSDVNWRHVKFIEQFSPDPDRSEAAWLMMSDVCKHCVDA